MTPPMHLEWVTVYGFRRWSRAREQHVVSPRKATIAALAAMPGCSLIEGTAEQVPSYLLDADGLCLEPIASPATALAAQRPSLPQGERRHG
ncbi:MAG TPA: hypothetical protein VMU47_15685 [Caldimonas sp.]|nr:hypothetical protein [Caldimonas sp.]